MVSSDAQLFVCCAHLDFSHMLSPVKQAGQCLAHDCLALRAIVGPSCFASPPSGMLEAQTSFSNLTVLCLARIIHKESETHVAQAVVAALVAAAERKTTRRCLSDAVTIAQLVGCSAHSIQY